MERLNGEITFGEHSLKVFPFDSQSIFGFGPSAEIDIILDGQDSRKLAEIKTEDGKKEKHPLFYDGESVTGKVSDIIASLRHLVKSQQQIGSAKILPFRCQNSEY